MPELRKDLDENEDNKVSEEEFNSKSGAMIDKICLDMAVLD